MNVIVTKDFNVDGNTQKYTIGDNLSIMPSKTSEFYLNIVNIGDDRYIDYVPVYCVEIIKSYSEGININKKDLNIDVGIVAYKRLMGINFTNKVTDIKLGNLNVKTGVSILHIPTGKYAYCISEGSQIKNKEKALNDLENQLAE